MSRREDLIICDRKLLRDSGKKFALPKYTKRNKAKLSTKIIMRRLPPSLTEEVFLKLIGPLPEHDFYCYVTADWSLGFDATCRAYISLKKYEDVFLFRDRFDGYVFVDSKGAEYQAILEFAPFQGLIKNRSRRVDNKVDTITAEPHYQKFLEKLEDLESITKTVECKLEFTLNRKNENKIISTPLLQYLITKRREDLKKRQEEKKRHREKNKEKTQYSLMPQQRKIGIVTKDGMTLESKNVISSFEITEDPHNESRSIHKPARDVKRCEKNVQRTYSHKDHNEMQACANFVINHHNNICVKQDLKSNDHTLNQVKKKKKLGKGNGIHIKKKSDNSDSLIKLSVISNKSADIDNNKQSCARSCIVRQKTTGRMFKSASSKPINIKSVEKQNSDSLLDYREKLACASTNINIRRSAEERRIRNKDRPSIAIYQPKARQLKVENVEHIYKDESISMESTSNAANIDNVNHAENVDI